MAKKKSIGIPFTEAQIDIIASLANRSGHSSMAGFLRACIVLYLRECFRVDLMEEER